MTEWWNNIPPEQKTYWFIAIPFTILFIIQTILSLIGMGGHSDFDGTGTDIDTGGHMGDLPADSHDIMAHGDSHDFNLNDTPATFRLLTLRNFIVFFTVFGWAGIVISKSGANTLVTILVSAALGLIVSAVISGIFYMMLKLTESGNMDIKNALNQIGEVYLTIPGKRKDTGKVTVVVQGVVRELEAVTDDSTLPTGTTVIVKGVIGSQVLLVDKYNEKGEA